MLHNEWEGSAAPDYPFRGYNSVRCHPGTAIISAHRPLLWRRSRSDLT